MNKWNFDPYILPLMKSRVLSPTSRARKVIGKTPKLAKELKLEFDSSMEKHLEKINNKIIGHSDIKESEDVQLYAK